MMTAMEQVPWNEALAIDADGIRDHRPLAEVPLLRWCDLRSIDDPVIRGRGGQRIRIPGDQEARVDCGRAIREAWRQHDPDGFRAFRRRAGWLCFRLVFLWLPVLALSHALVNLAFDLRDEGRSWPYVHETIKRMLPWLVERLPMIYLEMMKVLALVTGVSVGVHVVVYGTAAVVRGKVQRLRGHGDQHEEQDETVGPHDSSASTRSAV